MFSQIRARLNEIKASILWARALKAFNDGNAENALNYFINMSKLVSLLPHHHAFLGQLHVHRGDSELAADSFEKAKDITSKAGDAYGRYVNGYSRVFLHIIETQKIPHDLIKEIREIPCRPSLKRSLPLAKDDL